MIKNMTYRNLMAVIRKIEAKGCDFQESEGLARSIFAEFENMPQGMSIEELVRRSLTKDGQLKEYLIGQFSKEEEKCHFRLNIEKLIKKQGW